MSEFEVIMVVLLFWVAPVVVGTIIGKKNGRGGIGFVVPLFLSWLGVIFVVEIGDVKRDQAHAEVMAAVTTGGKEIVKVKCAKCGALVNEGVKFCSGCGAPM